MSTMPKHTCGDMTGNTSNLHSRAADIHALPRDTADGDVHPPGEQSGRAVACLAGLMPWVISALFHVSLALILLLIVMVVIATPKTTKLPTLISPTESPVPPTAIPFVGDKPLEQRDDARRAQDLEEPSGRRDHKVEADIDRRRKPVELSDLIAAGEIAQPGETACDGAFFGVGLGDIGKDPGDGSGSSTRFPGGKANVVYVLDRSGSMIDTFDHLRLEVGRSIGRLNLGCGFHVIFFAGSKPSENAPRRLVAADNGNRRDAWSWILDVRPEGQTDPLPALQRAFTVLKRARNEHPRIIYLLTDGIFPDNEKVLDAIRRMNADRSVFICTFLYGSRPPEAVEVMQRIARENRGVYRYVSLDE
ncbi:MAG: VWA domain-containing protein [Planctomycetes bacterium]|jgi:hypothetical protein|nr:VWA domain-containing protein [Phycisphaerae bacterium]NBB96095.1 VWA domain-containing protein [Planctomycetota bacterium]